jgi:hypothetical protein
MPTLPSGLTLAISSDALIDNGTNWFHCPQGHFWYWMIDSELNPPPFELEETILQAPAHAPAPNDRDGVKNFIRVLEMSNDGKFGWRGEWLATFPQYTALDDMDFAAWQTWMEKPETQRFLDEAMERCQRLATLAQEAQGYFVASDRP